jgi:hypothetical protein
MKTKLLLGIGISAIAVLAAPKVELMLNLEKGETYAQSTTIESTVKQTMMGQTQEVNQKISATTYMTMMEEGSETDDYEIWYDGISMSMSVSGQEQSFSSDTASLSSVDPISKILSGLVMNKFNAKITDKGIVKEVSGLEEMVEKATDGAPGGPGMSELIGGSFGDDGFAKSLELTTDIFPEKSKVKPGDSWSKTKYTQTGLPIISKVTYTLESVEDGKAEISVKANLETDPENTTTSIQGMEATVYYEGTREGTLTMDVATGWITSGTLTDDIVGSMNFAANAQMPDGMTVPVEMKNKVTISN